MTDSANSPAKPPNLTDIQDASQRIADHIYRTPLIECDRLSQQLGVSLRFKPESLQHEGSFKIRGATNAVLCLPETLARNGVIAHSSGNHAAALARAAMQRSIPAAIVMPHNSSPRKLNAVRQLGIEPHLCEPSSEEREKATERLIQSTKATLIHAYDDPNVIAGQGTVGLEIIEQVDQVDSIFVPVGGGGLLSGVLIAVKTLRPEVKIYGCEPNLADDAYRSLKAGKRLMPTRYDSIADGLRTALGLTTFPVIHRLVDDILLVDEHEIQSATRLLAETAGLVAEPSGAVTLAALKRHRERFQGDSVVAVISGGNIEMSRCQLGRLPSD